jgi:hypothetical protein
MVESREESNNDDYDDNNDNNSDCSTVSIAMSISVVTHFSFE